MHLRIPRQTAGVAPRKRSLPSTNSLETGESAAMSPLFFTSQAVPRVWGGRALAERLGHCLPTDQPYGETWDISGLPERASVVAEGPHRGKTLSELWKTHRRGLASSAATMGADFPLLIKWLDCRDQLSVQVHPDDFMAREVLQQPRGKSEIWIVLRAESTAQVQAGLVPGTTREDFLRHLEAGTLAECLHSFTPQPGDCVLLPAGTIHAGGGLLMAEVQQSSDATFRLFDWNRLGLDGKPRPLQIDLALQAIDWSQGPISPVTPRLMNIDQAGIRGEVIAERHAFRIERYTLTESWTAPHPGEMAIWMVLDGAVSLTQTSTAETWTMIQGRSVLVPASAGEVVWRPVDQTSSATLLCVLLPVSSHADGPHSGDSHCL